MKKFIAAIWIDLEVEAESQEDADSQALDWIIDAKDKIYDYQILKVVEKK